MVAEIKDMEEEKKLYPLKFVPITDKYYWGADEFKLADLGYRDNFIKEGWLASNCISEVMDMYMDRVVGENLFAWYGRQFPFQIKVIHVDGRMPLRVSPDDEIAEQRYDLLGKEKFWLILEATEKTAGQSAGEESVPTVFIGLNKQSNAGELYSKCLDGSVEEILNAVPVKAGDYLHIAPGTVHAASGRMTILEISESSPLDFCLYGWGTPVSPEEFDESLSLVEALDFIDYAPAAPAHTAAQSGTGPSAAPKENSQSGTGPSEAPESLLKLKQFTVNRMDLNNPVRVNSNHFDACTCYTCIRGAAVLEARIGGAGSTGSAGDAGSTGGAGSAGGLKLSYPLKAGECILVPAEVEEFVIAPTEAGTVLIETLVDYHEGEDAYINPNAAPTLDGEESGDAASILGTPRNLPS